MLMESFKYKVKRVKIFKHFFTTTSLPLFPPPTNLKMCKTWAGEVDKNRRKGTKKFHINQTFLCWKLFSYKSDSIIINVCPFVCHKAKALKQLKILHPSYFIFHFATFKLLSLFTFSCLIRLPASRSSSVGLNGGFCFSPQRLIKETIFSQMVSPK